jgi:integrase
MHVLPAFGEMPLRNITPVIVRQWVAEVQGNGSSRDMTRQAKQVLGAILNLAVEEGYIGRNPAQGVRLGKVAKAEKHFLTDEQVATLASQIQEPYGTWVWFMAYSGLRWGEMAALCRGRCDGRTVAVVQSLSEAGGLHFKPTKNYESRTVLLPAAIAELLTAHLDRHVANASDAFVFTSPGGELLRNSNFQRRIWKPALEAAGLPWAVRVHDLRHTCAALMVSEGANPKHIQRHLGHSSITVTMDTYGHLFPEDLRYIANRLDERISRVWQGTSEGRDPAEGDSKGSDADAGMPLTSQNASVGPAGIEPATKGL